MTNDDITVHVLRDIRDSIEKVHGDLQEVRGDLQEMRGDIQQLRDDMNTRVSEQTLRLDRVHGELIGFRQDVNARLERLEGEVRDHKLETKANFASVLMVLGKNDNDLDRRITRVEEHLGLAR